ncbi:cytochrome P450 [Leptodontidium sp. 2 PMI_412]|nr:cytochrome P450 [Leptodontidium sp. 2 PMI_412]
MTLNAMDIETFVATNLGKNPILRAIGGYFLLLFLGSVLRALFSPLLTVPGPFLARFTRMWYFLAVHRKYGPIVRIAPNYYSIDDPNAVKTIYGFSNSWKKGPWYSIVSDPNRAIPDLFSYRDIKRHAANRRQVASFFTVTSLVKMEEQIMICLRAMEQRFNEMASSGEEVNLPRWLHCYAFDVIGAVTVDKPFGFLTPESEALADLFKALQRELVYSTWVGVYYELHPIIFRCIKLLGTNGLIDILTFTSKQINDRLAKVKETNTIVVESKSDGEDFLTRILRLHQEQPQAYTMDHVHAACMQNIGAGSDSTSVSLSAVMRALLENPEVMNKTQNMPYLQAVVKEVLRNHPAMGIALDRIVPQGGATIAGRFFPEGAVVSMNAWVAHANRDVFGQDADSFRPERWLVDKEEIQVMERYILTWGAGPRTCLGKNVALMEMTKLVPHLVRKFDISLVEPDKPLENVFYGFVKKKQFMVRIKKRESQLVNA